MPLRRRAPSRRCRNRKRVTARLWRQAGGDPKRNGPPEVRARYLELLREHGYIYEREDGVWVHTEKNPRKGESK